MSNTFLFANLAGSTLAGAISSTATTINLAAGTGALFPSPAAGQQFAMRLISAANSTYTEIVYVTAVSTDALTVVRAQEGTAALSFNAGDFAKHVVTAASLGNFVQSGTSIQKVPATTFYVNGSTGNDSNPGTLTLPFATLQGAYNYISQFFSPTTVSINVAAGTYTVAANGVGMFGTTNLIAGWNIVGAGVGSTILDASASGATGIYFNYYQGTVNVTGMTVNGSAYCFRSGQGVTMTFGTVAAVLSTTSVSVGFGGISGNFVFSGSNITLSGSGAIGFQSKVGSINFGQTAVSVTLSSLTVSTALFSGSYGGVIIYSAANVTWSGSNANSKFYVLQGGGLDTSGSGTSSIPGTAGTIVSASCGWQT